MHAVNVPDVPLWRVPDKHFTSCHQQIAESLYGHVAAKVTADKQRLPVYQVILGSQRMPAAINVQHKRLLQLIICIHRAHVKKMRPLGPCD